MPSPLLLNERFCRNTCLPKSRSLTVAVSRNEMPPAAVSAVAPAPPPPAAPVAPIVALLLLLDGGVVLRVGSKVTFISPLVEMFAIERKIEGVSQRYFIDLHGSVVHIHSLRLL